MTSLAILFSLGLSLLVVAGDRPPVADTNYHPLVRLLHLKDRYSFDHSLRVASSAAKLAEKIGLCEDQVAKVQLAALFHDIGNLEVRREILSKPTVLTVDEWNEIVSHSERGFEISSFIGLPKEVQIPLGARIISVGDAYDSMLANRIYRRPMDTAKARKQLRRQAGRQFDPDLVHAFISESKPAPP